VLEKENILDNNMLKNNTGGVNNGKKVFKY